MLSKTGFAKDRRAISIQDQAQIRNLDSEKGMPRFDNFKIQFYSSILDTFSIASVNHVVCKCDSHFRFTPDCVAKSRQPKSVELEFEIIESGYARF